MAQAIALINRSPKPNPMFPHQHVTKKETHWIVIEVLAFIDGSLDFNKVSIHEIVNDEVCVPIVGNKEIEHYFPRGNDHNLVRAQLLVHGYISLYKYFE